MLFRSAVPLLALSLTACPRPQGNATSSDAGPGDAEADRPNGYSVLARHDFNNRAVHAAEPVFWVEDRNGNRQLDPDELAVFPAYGKAPTLSSFVEGGRFTPAFAALYRALSDMPSEPKGDLPHAELERRRALLKELDAGRISLLSSDFRDLPLPLQQASAKILEAAAITERIYHRQMGIDALTIPDDGLSRAAFWRNQGPRCTAPTTSGNPHCHATEAPAPAVLSGLYPKSLLEKEGFCDGLAKTLTDPFTVVVEREGKLEAVPYHVHYAAELGELAALLDEAAQLLTGLDDEAALAAYLRAAATAARTGSWFDADEAWAKMNAQNSKLYLRIGPDEVYDEPCSTKALFHTSFGRINQASLTLQNKLDPKKQEMEAALAALAGAPYTERTVTFRLPDFMDVAINAGDARQPSGATIGQSLPNFGPVANEGRGRTVAMTNLYQDPDNVASARRGAQSLLCKDTFRRYSDSPDGQILSTVLHEAAHNLGPSHQYKVGGKIDRDVFGGPLASTLEELKAQSSALFLADWLKEKGELSAEEADTAHVRDLTWMLGHISRGMFTDNGHPRNYSQLAAVQLGFLLKSEAISFRPDELAENGTDKGCYSLDAGKFPAAAKELVTLALQVKAKGDKATAEAWLKEYVGDKPDAEFALKSQHALIKDRLLRLGKATFVYRVELASELSPAPAKPAPEADAAAAQAPSADAQAPEVDAKAPSADAAP